MKIFNDILYRFNDRYAVQEVELYLQDKTNQNICCILGQRRIGKTEILKSIYSKNSTNSLFIQCENVDSVRDIVRVIENNIENGKTIFILDEVTEIYDFLDNSNMLYDYLTGIRNIKIVMSGTLSPLINWAEIDPLFGRITKVQLYPMSVFEYMDVVKPNSLDYESITVSYLEHCGVFVEKDETGLKTQLKAILRTIERIAESKGTSTPSEEEVIFYLLMVIFKAVWTGELTNKKILTVAGFPKERNIQIYMDKLFRTISKYEGTFNKKEFGMIFDILEQIGIIKRITNIASPMGDYKYIVTNMSIKMIILNMLHTMERDHKVKYNINKYNRPLLFENAMNYSTMIDYGVYNVAGLATNHYESDEVIMYVKGECDTLLLVDYKNNTKDDIQPTALFKRTDKEIIDILHPRELFNDHKVEKSYVHRGDENSSVGGVDLLNLRAFKERLDNAFSKKESNDLSWTF